MLGAMTHPSYSHMADPTLDRVQHLAGELQRAAEAVARLSRGGGTVANNHLGVGGRQGDKSVATNSWTGPHRDAFESLFADEMDAASTAERHLLDEAEAWARFRLMAMAAREQRLHDEAVAAASQHAPATRPIPPGLGP